MSDIRNANRADRLGDDGASRREAASLALQNKGGISLAIGGLALGCAIGSPWLAILGLASGFVAGNLGIDGKQCLVANLIGPSGAGGSYDPREGDAPLANSPDLPAHQPTLQSTSSIRELCSAQLDPSFAVSNGMLVPSATGAVRTAQRQR